MAEFLKRFKEKVKSQDTWDKITCGLAEVLGTAILVFLGCGGCIKTNLFPNNHLQLAFNFGLAVLIAIQCVGCISGAHLNPAVTVGAYIYGKISLSMSLVYFVAQIVGAFAGYALLQIVMPYSTMHMPNGFCVTLPHFAVSPAQAFGIEFLSTAILLFICCGVWDPRNAAHHDSVPVRFGLAVACLAITVGPFTGCSLNPARSLAPAVWNGNYASHWIYWLAPLSGGAIATLVYRAVFRRRVSLLQTTVQGKVIQLEEVQLN
ncbi:aquaporin AQPcic-like [Drosophila busckii]|uniref:aquaporin AQPcic-like n=1 Tax=Drosophila busckii TaxID=30019 RepID=UPI00083EAC80|nr:aquaporin AQPcic-like [Drosophila busckii]